MRADASANRRALLDAARTLLVTEPDASLAAVAEAAGVSRRTVYAHFSSRADLLDQVAADLGRSLADHMADQPADDDPVRALAHLLFTTNATLTDFHRVGEAALRSGARATLLAETGAVRQRVRGLVEAGLSSGRLRCPLSPAAAVPMLTGLQQGVFEAVIAGDLAPSAAPEALVRLALAALGLDPAEIDALAGDGAGDEAAR